MTRITPATEADARQIATLIRESHRDVAQMFGLTRENNPKHPSFCTTDWVLADFKRGEEYFLGAIGENAVGCMAFEQPDPDTAYLNRLSVLPGHRRQGMGAALVRHIVAHAASRQAKVISIGIIAAHETLKAWYERLGFVEHETRTFVHLPFDVMFMHYRI